MVTQDERLNFLLRYLLAERKEYEDITVPDSLSEKRLLLRSLMNVRSPVPAREDFLRVQDAYLGERLAERGVTRLSDLTPVRPGLYLWQGDITTLAAETGIGSIAFCCISTGEFRFPNELAAEIAIQTVGEWQRQNPDKIKVIFNVFKDRDYEIYKRLLR